MHPGDHFWASAVSDEGQRTQSSPLPLQDESERAPHAHRRAGRPASSRWWEALAWVAGAAAVFTLFLRIKLSEPPSSDAANNALQAWDLLHGHLLLHGWIIGDATYYTFELPLMALVELFLGLHTIAVHVTVVLTYLIVIALAAAIAVTDSKGYARAVRAWVLTAVLVAAVLVASDMWIVLGFPDHTGTTIFLLLPCLLIDLAPARRFTAPLVCVILAAGQIGDVTVRYVAVPAIIVLCAYRIVAERSIKTGDAANLVAALVSLPLATVVRAVMRHFHAYLMVSPKTSLAPFSQWPHNAYYTWHSIRMLFGTVAEPGDGSAGKTAIFGFACLIFTTAGVLVSLWRWRRLRRAEQLLLITIVINLVVYTVSTLPSPESPHDIVAVLPASAILAVRALVPDRITVPRLTAAALTCAAVIAVLLPLSVTAVNRGPETPSWESLAKYLNAQGLHYGLGGYWDGSSATLQSGGGVAIRTVEIKNGKIRPIPWETDTTWFDPAQHYASFVVINLKVHDLGPSAEPYFGKPVRTHRVGVWEVLIFNKNLLRLVAPPVLPPTS
jgi:hypothetical protein